MDRTLRTPLFPDTALRISVTARDELEFTVLRSHLAQVVAHAEQIRSQIACEALEIYRLYREEEGAVTAYADITSPDAIWPLIKPVAWAFALGGSHHKPRVEIDFGWPNPHFLGVYVDDTALYICRSRDEMPSVHAGAAGAPTRRLRWIGQGLPD